MGEFYTKKWVKLYLRVKLFLKIRWSNHIGVNFLSTDYFEYKMKTNPNPEA